jgi:hypothetical protein
LEGVAIVLSQTLTANTPHPSRHASCASATRAQHRGRKPSPTMGEGKKRGPQT